MPQQFIFPQQDVSGAVQVGTSHLMRKRNEVQSSKNASFNIKVGSAIRRPGYEQLARTIEPGNDSLYGGVYRYGNNFKVLAGVNNVADTAATLRVMDTGNYWTTLISTAPVNTRFNCVHDNDQLFVAGGNDQNQYMPLTNIDSTLTPSTSRNVFGAPASKFITEFGGQLVAINCQVNGKAYPDRFYVSSPPLGAVTFVQTDQNGLLNQLRVDSVQYLKVGQSFDIYSAGTDSKLVTVVLTYVDKKNDRIGFNPTQFTGIKDNDEIWLTGSKGTLSRFWNTDYRTPETADWAKVPPGKEANPQFTGYGSNNNRLLLFTKNSTWKYDGGQLVNVSDTIGCVSHETIQNISGWTIWLHNTGVWAYNDSTGQLKMLSRTISLLIRAINQANLSKASAGVVDGRVYKLAVGELMPLGSDTTSTSTSSTSTSSTSSSTSSTSTSSTSTSSTSSSTSMTTVTTFTTSTSSTSSSISTSSTSTSSTTTSTSTSSTSTSTVASSKKVCRLIYDFDLNAWWTEEHKREIRFQFNHTMSGYTKPYFTDETGRMFRDETGIIDHHDTIPMELEWGRDNLGIDQKKVFRVTRVDSESAQGGTLQYAVDGGPFKTFGQKLSKPVSLMMFPQSGQLVEGFDIDYKYVHNEASVAPEINGLFTYCAVTESIPSEAS